MGGLPSILDPEQTHRTCITREMVMLSNRNISPEQSLLSSKIAQHFHCNFCII